MVVFWGDGIVNKVVEILLYKDLDSDINPDGEDILKVVDYAIAEIDPQTKKAFITTGDYMGYQIDELDSNYQDREFSYVELDRAKVDPYKELTMPDMVGRAQRTMLPTYYQVSIQVSVGDNAEVILNPVIDRSLKVAFERYPSPVIYQQIVDKAQEQQEQYNPFGMDELANNKVTRPNNSPLYRRSQYDESDIATILAKLKERIIGLDDQLELLLTGIVKNISLSHSVLDPYVMKNLKSNILLMGPQGSGKTYMVQNIAEFLGIPYVVIDGSTFFKDNLPSKWAESILEQLYLAANGEIDAFERGIVFIDDFDMACAGDPRTNTHDEIQKVLVKMMDGTKVSHTIMQNGSTRFVTLDSTKITFVFAGEFKKIYGLPKAIKDGTLHSADINNSIVTRLDMRITTHAPSREHLRDALVNPEFGLIGALEEYLKTFDIDLEVSDEFIDIVVIEADGNYHEGYPVLNRVLNNKLQKHLFGLYNGDIKQLVLGKQNNKNAE